MHNCRKSVVMHKVLESNLYNLIGQLDPVESGHQSVSGKVDVI